MIIVGVPYTESGLIYIEDITGSMGKSYTRISFVFCGIPALFQGLSGSLPLFSGSPFIVQHSSLPSYHRQQPRLII